METYNKGTGDDSMPGLAEKYKVTVEGTDEGVVVSFEPMLVLRWEFTIAARQEMETEFGAVAYQNQTEMTRKLLSKAQSLMLSWEKRRWLVPSSWLDNDNFIRLIPLES